MQSRQLYQFGDFELDPAEQILRRDGQPVSLTPKTFDLLVFLVEHRGRLVTKDQILEAVWQDSFVEESNLTVSVSALRKALGEKRGENQYIDTVPKKGYRFTANVTEVAGLLAPKMASQTAVGGSSARAAAASGDSEEGVAVEIAGRLRPQFSGSSTPSAGVVPFEVSPALGPRSAAAGRFRVPSLRAALLAALCLVAVIVATVSFLRRKTPSPPFAAPKQLAVLPFQNLRHDSAIDFLGFSLADAVINRLGYVSELTIRPSYAIQKYRTEVPDIEQVGRELSVDTLLTGNFIREGDHLRVSYQLVDVNSDRILRKGTIDLKYQNLLAVQDDVSAQVINALAVTLSASEAEHLKNEGSQFLSRSAHELPHHGRSSGPV